MKIKKEIILLPILIAALSAYLVFRQTDRTYYQLPKVPDLAGINITKIEIDKGAASIVLNKKWAGWEISPQGFPADTDKVKGMMDTLKNLTLTALVSEAKDYFRYDLTGDKKIRVRAWASDALKCDLEVGKAASTFRHTFVRLAGDDRVYQAAENFRNIFDLTMDDLRDKAVLAFGQGEIQEISITKGYESLVLKRKEVSQETKTTREKGSSPAKMETVWEESGGKKASQKEVTHILSDLSDLKCEKYLDEAKEDFKAPIYKIDLKGNKGYRLSIYAKKEKADKEYPAVSSENRSPFLLSDWQVEKIMKDPKQLIE